MDADARAAWEAVQKKALIEWAKDAARRLQQMADAADRASVEMACQPIGLVVEAASEITHAVSWGVANMQLDRPARAAASLLSQQEKEASHDD